MVQKDKVATKEKLLDAVGQVISEQGFQGLGINIVAKTAGVDKVLIYRYFKNLDGLIKSYISREDYFSNLDQITEKFALKSKEDFVRFSQQLFIGQLREILENQGLQEILLWELTHQNEILQELAQTREEKGVALNRHIEKIVDSDKIDIPALSTLLIGGINYLVLRSRNVDVYSGIDLNSEKGWERIEGAIRIIIELIAEKI